MRNIGPRSSMSGKRMSRLRITLESPSISSALICNMEVKAFIEKNENYKNRIRRIRIE